MTMLRKDILDKLYKSDFEKIINFIKEVSNILVDDYNNKNLRLPNDENKIRSIMLEDYIKKQKTACMMQEYRFLPEVPENYKRSGVYIGRVDIHVILKNDFEKEDAYYIIECKRIDGSTDMNKKYVKKGIARFIDEKYSCYYGRNIMLGFVVKNIDICKNALELEKIQNNDTNTKLHGKFFHLGNNGIVKIYKCMYGKGNDKLELAHIFSDYSSLI